MVSGRPICGDEQVKRRVSFDTSGCSRRFEKFCKSADNPRHLSRYLSSHYLMGFARGRFHRAKGELQLGGLSRLCTGQRSIARSTDGYAAGSMRFPSRHRRRNLAHHREEVHAKCRIRTLFFSAICWQSAMNPLETRSSACSGVRPPATLSPTSAELSQPSHAYERHLLI